MMNKIFNVISTFFKRAFACFSLLTLAFAIIGKSISGNEMLKYISADFILAFFAFSVLFAFFFLVSDFVRNNILRRFLQFVFTYIDVAVVFFAGGALENYVLSIAVQNKAFSVLAISFIFVIIYVVFGLVSLVSALIKSKLCNNNKEYSEMFENN